MRIDEFDEDLSRILRVVGEEIRAKCYLRTLECVRSLGLPELIEQSVPLEAWLGIAQAMADATGFRVILQGAIMEKISQNEFRVIGHKEVAKADPTLFTTEVLAPSE
jgi:hypothetical protein